jgi:non-ribosomal peptide synthetase
LLGVERVGRHDNFFDLGGHSLLVMSLLSRMKERGLYCSVAQVFQFPSIAQQEHLLLDGNQIPSGDDCLVPMRPGGSEDAVPLFLIHEVSGTVMAYVPMVSLLGGDFPVYGLHAMNFDLDGKEFLSVGNMASSYVDAIRRVQPNGPYRLFGWSAGGLIAYEVGRQLVEMGESIDFITMIDTYVHCSFGMKSSDVDLKGSALGFIDRVMDVDRSDFKRMMSMNSMEEVIDEYCRISTGDAVSRDDMIRRVNVEHRITKSVFDYRPKVIEGDVYLFLAPEVTQDALDVGQSDRKQAEYVRGWEYMKEQGPTVIPIGGNHASIMQPPHLQKVVDKINDLVCEKM